MAEYRYTPEDRRKQLEALASALGELIPVVAELPEFSPRVGEYEAALRMTERLLRAGFTQEQASALSDAVPDLYFRHKEWCPPLIRTSSGEWREPEWFVRLESRLQPALRAAAALRVVGYY